MCFGALFCFSCCPSAGHTLWCSVPLEFHLVYFSSSVLIHSFKQINRGGCFSCYPLEMTLKYTYLLFLHCSLPSFHQPCSPFRFLALVKQPFLRDDSSPPIALLKAAFTSPFPRLEVHCRKPLDQLPALFSVCLCCKNIPVAHPQLGGHHDLQVHLCQAAIQPVLGQFIPTARTRQFPFLKFG